MMMLVAASAADDVDVGQALYYHKSKNLNVSTLNLQKNDKFNYINVDTNVSTIHVPTHVYDECTCIIMPCTCTA